MRYVMTFSYDGSNYAGFQIQKNKNTIQSEIETALFKITKQRIKIVGSGRTDAKVHAIQATAHFDLVMNISSEQLKKALNSLISKDIYILKIKKVVNDFHARFDIKKKEYFYVINMGDYNVFERNYALQLNKALKIKKMQKAIKDFEGIHNFESFCKKSKGETDFVRTIFETNIKQKEDKVFIYFVGNGFLRYMVRNMVGALIEIGLEKREETDIAKILKNKDRKTAGVKAPAEGLYLKSVSY